MVYSLGTAIRENSVKVEPEWMFFWKIKERAVLFMIFYKSTFLLGRFYLRPSKVMNVFQLKMFM